jgi:hypothetical protein
MTIITITAINNHTTHSPKCQDYPCSLCSYFHYDRGGWGNCELMNVRVNGSLRACRLSTPFVCPKKH